jgi:hypothetical protein
MSKSIRKNLSVCQTKHTETSSCGGDLQESFGLFTFSKEELKIPREDLNRKPRQLSESHLLKHPISYQSLNKSLEIENQILEEKIKGIEIEVKNAIFEESNILMHHIQKNQSKIESLKEKLHILNHEQEHLQKIRSDIEYIKKIEHKNRDLALEIASIKENIRSKHSNSVPLESSVKINQVLKQLEDEQSENLRINMELKLELESLKAINFKKSFEIVDIEDQDKLFMIYVEVFRILSVAEKFHRGEQVRLQEFLEFPSGVSKLTPAQMIALIKESTRKLKTVISDIYADHCGNLCQVN